MAMTPRTWSISALATEFAMDRRTVASRLRDIPPAGAEKGRNVWRLADVAPVLTNAAWAVSDAGEMSIDEAKRRKAAAEAALSEIALARERDEVVDIAVAIDTVGKGLDMCRSRLLSIPTKVAPLIANEADAAACKAHIESAIHDALAEISGPDFIPVESAGAE